ncbi:hypothetical protein FQN57_000807 [Myotisia sp. PD_48]|nr:hypothetical protein FQN57_000807 [Myotisia sp. PD_48]
MVYYMEIYTDGGCRRNGQPGAIGAAAAAIKNRYGKYRGWQLSLPSNPRPTNQRAEITAIILALEKASEKYDELNSKPRLDVKIYSDSRYVVGCMTTWVDKWENNGWTNSAGKEVANRDLLEEAWDLDNTLRQVGRGDIEYIWIPREKNEYADRLCNEDMDEQEEQGKPDRCETDSDDSEFYF